MQSDAVCLRSNVDSESRDCMRKSNGAVKSKSREMNACRFLNEGGRHSQIGHFDLSYCGKLSGFCTNRPESKWVGPLGPN